MVHQFLRFIEQENLCSSKDKILIAVSGGMDSMVMLSLFQSAHFQIGVGHVNFGLRGNESEKDCAFVREYCAGLKIPFHSIKVDTNNYAVSNGISIQMAARDLRYSWFEELANQVGYTKIATGHHKDDHSETMVLNLIHARTITGLLGIPVKNGKIIRPLIFADRKMIESFAKSSKLTWREDASNQNDVYHRNFVRHKILPLMSALNPGITDSLMKTAAKASGELELLEIGLKLVKDKVVGKNKFGWTKVSKGALLQFEHPGAILYLILKDFGFSFEMCQNAVFNFNEQPGNHFFSNHFEMTTDRESVIIKPKKIESEIKSERIGDAGTFLLMNWKMVCEKMNPNFSRKKNEASVDLALLDFPLLWRKWRHGDTFIPLGMDKQKKLSDFFIDAKVSNAEKEEATVVESNGQIIWVVGHRLSEHFKVTPETEQIFRMRVEWIKG